MNRVQILTLEDNLKLATKLASVLHGIGVDQVKNARSIYEFEKELEESTPDFALLDYCLLEKANRLDLVDRLDTEKIPSVCLVTKNGIKQNANGTMNEIYQIIGKQFSRGTLKQSIQESLNIGSPNTPDSPIPPLTDKYFFVKSQGELTKVYSSQILYVKAEGNYAMVQTSHKKYAIKLSLKRLQTNFPELNFSRIHRSYLVQLEKVTRVNIKDNTIVVGDIELPIGRHYKATILREIGN